MVDVDRAVVLKYSRKGKIFSILIDAEKAVEFRKGKVDLDEVIATDDIYTDVKKGNHASEHELKDVFGTDNKRKVAEVMIRDGELPVTKKQKDEGREEKRKQIVNIITRNAVDPKTGLPHPPQRIESAVEEVKASIDENKTAEEQVPEIIKQISSVLAIKFEVKKLELVVPAKCAGQAFGLIKREAKVLENEWKNDGSLRVVVEIPVGIQDKFFTDVNHVCHGEVESKEIK